MSKFFCFRVKTIIVLDKWITCLIRTQFFEITMLSNLFKLIFVSKGIKRSKSPPPLNFFLIHHSLPMAKGITSECKFVKRVFNTNHLEYNKILTQMRILIYKMTLYVLFLLIKESTFKYLRRLCPLDFNLSFYRGPWLGKKITQYHHPDINNSKTKQTVF